MTLNDDLIRGFEKKVQVLEQQLEDAHEAEKPTLREELEFQSSLLNHLRNPPEFDVAASMDAFVIVLSEAATVGARDLPAVAQKAKVLFARLDPYPEKHTSMTPRQKFQAVAGQLAFQMGDPHLAEGALRIADGLFGSED